MYEIFICYRRSDGIGLTRFIHKVLSDQYKVFYDQTSVIDGNYRKRIQLVRCNI